jgi:hypothetical protein
MRNAYKILVKQYERKGPLDRPRLNGRVILKANLRVEDCILESFNSG